MVLFFLERRYVRAQVRCPGCVSVCVCVCVLERVFGVATAKSVTRAPLHRFSTEAEAGVIIDVDVDMAAGHQKEGGVATSSA